MPETETPTLRDAAVDEDMAADWQDILSRHSRDDADGTDTHDAARSPSSDDKGDTDRKPAVGADDDTGADGRAEEGSKDRRPDGKFRRGNQYRRGTGSTAAAADREGGDEKPGTKPPAGDTTTAAPTGEQPPAPDTQQRDITKPPTTWRPTARAEWGKLPEPVRAEIHRREADFMAGQSQLLPDAKYGKELREVIDPFRMLIESEGGTPALAVQDLLRTAAVLRTGSVQQKYQTVANIAARFGVDLRMFAPRPPALNQPGAPGAQPGSAPTATQFFDPRVDQLLRSMQTEQQQRAAREQADTEQMAGAWLNEVDAQGQPKRPYAGDVIDEMSALIPQIRQQNPTLTHAQLLELAYERAIWGNPEIRALLQKEQQATADATRRAESQRRAEDARRAASVNVRRRGAPPAAGKPGTLEETIASTARELGLI